VLEAGLAVEMTDHLGYERAGGWGGHVELVHVGGPRGTPMPHGDVFMLAAAGGPGRSAPSGRRDRLRNAEHVTSRPGKGPRAPPFGGWRACSAVVPSLRRAGDVPEEESEMSEFPEEAQAPEGEDDRYEAPIVEDFGDAVDLTLGNGGATPDGSAFTTWGSY
jgi:hypothetical protein